MKLIILASFAEPFNPSLLSQDLGNSGKSWISRRDRKFLSFITRSCQDIMTRMMHASFSVYPTIIVENLGK